MKYAHLHNVNDYRSLYVSQKLVVNMLFNMPIIFLKKKYKQYVWNYPQIFFFRKLVIE